MELASRLMIGEVGHRRFVPTKHSLSYPAVYACYRSR